MCVTSKDINEKSRGMVLLHNILDMCNGIDGRTILTVLGACLVEVMMGSVLAKDRKVVVDGFCDFLKERVKARTESETKTNEKK